MWGDKMANCNNFYSNNINAKKSNSNKSCPLFSNGQSLNIIAAATANVLAEQFTEKEIAVLALFFSTLGDALGTIAAANALLCNNEQDELFLEETLQR